jgi:hypothetical protein
MRKLTTLSLLIISVLFITSQIVCVSAESFSREFRDIGQSYSPTDRRFSYDVIATIQTEPDGSWLIGNTYQVTYTIKLTYVNETLYDINSLTVRCYDSNAVQYQTEATFQNSGTLTFNVKAETGMDTYGLDQGFSSSVYDNQGSITAGSWFPSMYDEPIKVKVMNVPINTSNAFSRNLSIEPLYLAVILAIIVVIVAVAIIAYKLGRKVQLR